MDFSDLPLPGAHDRSDAEKRTAILATVRNYVLAFLDQNPRVVNSTMFQWDRCDE